MEASESLPPPQEIGVKERRILTTKTRDMLGVPWGDTAASHVHARFILGSSSLSITWTPTNERASSDPSLPSFKLNIRLREPAIDKEKSILRTEDGKPFKRERWYEIPLAGGPTQYTNHLWIPEHAGYVRSDIEPGAYPYGEDDIGEYPEPLPDPVTEQEFKELMDVLNRFPPESRVA